MQHKGLQSYFQHYISNRYGGARALATSRGPTEVISTARNRLLGTIIIWKWLCSVDANLVSNRSVRFKYAQTVNKQTVELLRGTDRQ